MSGAQTAHSRALRLNLICLSLLVRCPLCQGMFSGRYAPENVQLHQRGVRSLPEVWCKMKLCHTIRIPVFAFILEGQG